MFSFVLVSVALFCSVQAQNRCTVQNPEGEDAINWEKFQGAWYAVLTSDYNECEQCVRIYDFKTIRNNGYMVVADVMNSKDGYESISSKHMAYRFDHLNDGVFTDRYGPKKSLKFKKNYYTYRTDYKNYFISISCNDGESPEITVYTTNRHPSSREFELIYTTLMNENIFIPLYMSDCPIIEDLPSLPEYKTAILSQLKNIKNP